MDKQEWLRALKSFSEVRRQHNPIPSRDSLSVEEEWHCRIIGGEIVSWFQRQLPQILRQRNALRIVGFDPEPVIVLTTTVSGLVASQEILTEPSEGLVCLVHSEFQEWEEQHPASDFIFHVHHWSYLRQIDQELLSRARQAYPEITPAAYRIHTSGEMWGKQCGVEGNHLWYWNGQEMMLLEEAFSQAQF